MVVVPTQERFTLIYGPTAADYAGWGVSLLTAIGLLGGVVVGRRRNVVYLDLIDRPELTLEHEDGTRSSLEPVEADVAVGAGQENDSHQPNARLEWIQTG